MATPPQKEEKEEEEESLALKDADNTEKQRI